MADGSDLRAWMRQGVRDVLHRVDGSRQISGSSLIALMCAAALAPVVAAGVAAGPVIVAAVGVAGSVGANILTDVVKGQWNGSRGTVRRPRRRRSKKS